MSHYPKKSKVFSQFESNTLASIVNEHKHILENKLTDSKTNYIKAEVWKLVEKEYNSVSGVSYRDHFQLKKRWENMKAELKRRKADEHFEPILMQNGCSGGQAVIPKIEDWDHEEEAITAESNRQPLKFDDWDATDEAMALFSKRKPLKRRKTSNDSSLQPECDANLDKCKPMSHQQNQLYELRIEEGRLRVEEAKLCVEREKLAIIKLKRELEMSEELHQKSLKNLSQ